MSELTVHSRKEKGSFSAQQGAQHHRVADPPHAQRGAKTPPPGHTPGKTRTAGSSHRLPLGEARVRRTAHSAPATGPQGTQFPECVHWFQSLPCRGDLVPAGSGFKAGRALLRSPPQGGVSRWNLWGGLVGWSPPLCHLPVVVFSSVLPVSACGYSGWVSFPRKVNGGFVCWVNLRRFFG